MRRALHRVALPVGALALLAALGNSVMSQTTAPHGHRAELFNPDGSPKYTNALAKETSPYLLQHAHNPVDWHPWGREAFELARKLDKPIFLSIGYSTCYWCHVMERQCFENPAIARVMNEHFVNIKVDREERPDVDDIYMLAVQVMTGHGGWPMSVFLTPPGAANPRDRGLRPFYAGTYFPPEPMHGRPGFPQILTSLSDAWKNRKREVVEQGDEIAKSVSQHLGRVDQEGELSIDLVSTAANRLLRSYDPEHGGFGGAPKFPTPSNLFFLLEVYRNNPNPEVWGALAHTLDRMARGGMYDQIGGGFHRYSTDERWLVPHFEKMLYDNGQLVETYLIAQSIKPDANEPGLYPRIVRQTCDYVLREMTDATGAFYSAQDAEVDALEGGNYLWRFPEITQVIADRALANLAIKMYGIDQGPNFQDPHHPDAPAGNVLYLPMPLNELATRQAMTLDELLKEKKHIDGILLAERNQRKQPGTDDKVLTAWNGIMIAGMARAGRDLNEPRYTEAAGLAAQAILDLMRTPDGGLLRSMRRGHAKIPAFLDDYAFLVHGLIELHRATGDKTWLDSAKRLTEIATAKFGTGAGRGGYYDTLADQADLFVRARQTYDGAIPSGNSQMVHNQLDLYEITQDQAYLDRAVLDLRASAGALRKQGSGMARMQQALLRAFQLAPQALPGATTRPVAEREGGRRQVVSIEAKPERIDLTSGPATVAVTLRIGPEYHVNAHEPGMKDLIPTTVELRGGKGVDVSVKYPEGKSKRYPFADEAILIYEDAVTIEVTLTPSGRIEGTPTLTVSYQVCTDESCLQPRTEEVPVVIQTKR